MSKGYRHFLLIMLVFLAAGIWIFVYGVTHPSRLPRMTPRNISAVGYLHHG